MVARCCMVGMMLVNSPLLGQGNETNPAGQALSAETNVGLPTAPKDPDPTPGRDARQASGAIYGARQDPRSPVEGEFFL